MNISFKGNPIVKTLDFELEVSYGGEIKKGKYFYNVAYVTIYLEGESVDFEYTYNEAVKFNIEEAFKCYLLDCCAGKESFYEFCDNYGFDNKLISSLEIYKKCYDAYKEFDKLLGCADTNFDSFINLLPDDYLDI